MQKHLFQAPEIESGYLTATDFKSVMSTYSITLGISAFVKQMVLSGFEPASIDYESITSNRECFRTPSKTQCLYKS